MCAINIMIIWADFSKNGARKYYLACLIAERIANTMVSVLWRYPTYIFVMHEAYFFVKVSLDRV